MGKRIKLILAIILFVSGLFIFVYPRVTDMMYKNDVSNKIEEFDKEISNNIENVSNNGNVVSNNYNSNYYSYDDLYRLLESRNNELYQSKQSSFFSDKSYEYDDINLRDYGISSNILGFITIPSINITLPIYLGANNSNMRLGAVHLTGSSYPIGGNNTNSVIAAHRGYYRTSMFRHIDNIKIGDRLYIKNFRETLVYRAVNIAVIDANDIGKLGIQDNKDMVTIISCHPYPFNYQRYVVYFERET